MKQMEISDNLPEEAPQEEEEVTSPVKVQKTILPSELNMDQMGQNCVAGPGKKKRV